MQHKRKIMTKIIKASEILRKKGYKQGKFDTNGFINTVGQFFLDHDISSKLLLIPFRFLDVEVDGDDPCKVFTLDDIKDLSYSDLLDYSHIEGFTFNNPYSLSWKDRLLGYKIEDINERRISSLKEYDPEDYERQKSLGILFPRVIIDKPYIENAAHMLHIMADYVVERGKGKQSDMFWVTLI